jgi:hypothetical protein
VLVTASVAIGNATLVWPASTVTLDPVGITPGLLLVKLTASPPAGAGPASLTVPVVLMPPVIGLGLTVKLETVSGFTVNVAVVLAPLYVAVKVTVVAVVTALVVTGNDTDEVPAASETLEMLGTTAVLLLIICNAAPPAGALPVSVTVPDGLVPAETVDGLKDMEAGFW